VTQLVNLSDTTVVKAGNAFCVALRDGSLPLAGDHPLGVYLDDCRHLRSYELRVGGQPPRLLIASDAAGTAALFEFTNPDLVLAGGRELPLQSLRVRLERRMLEGAMLDRLTLRSYAREAADFELELRFDADFRPMLEVRGLVSGATREVRRHASGDTLSFAAVGLDGRERSTTITCPGAFAEHDGRIRLRMRLEPAEERTLGVRFALTEPDSGARPNAGRDRLDGHASMARAGAEADDWIAGHLRIEVDDELVDRVLRRSLLDLRLLVSKLDGRRYYAAGVPWYATLFGRDSIISAMQMLTFDSALAGETLRVLADRLGRVVDDEHDEEPGKVLHELRRGEVAATDLTPLTRYYGTVDATPLFLCLLREHADWTGSLDLFRELRPHVEAALSWIEDYGDLDGDGLLEYHCRAPGGLANQGWKDSWDGVVDEHGVPARAPIALVEVQGYAMRAQQGMAELLELEGEADRAEELRARAARASETLERFWLPDRGYYSMALDAEKRPSRALASNQGHLLWAQAVPSDRAAAITEALMNEGSYSGWGVRTLSADERAFNPVGYHTGSVWPHDNAFLALGLRNYGFDEPFLRLFEDLLDAAASFDHYRLPELFAGFSRADYEAPVPYPVACSPQAWAAGTLPAMLRAGLGLLPDGLNRTLRIRRPSLPRHVERLALHGLRVAGARVDLLFERVGHRADRVALTDVQVEGDLDVVLEIPHQLEPGREGQTRAETGAARSPA
jgi:glycogen debranching enzyme